MTAGATGTVFETQRYVWACARGMQRARDAGPRRANSSARSPCIRRGT
jgi:hypothetical protein